MVTDMTDVPELGDSMATTTSVAPLRGVLKGLRKWFDEHFGQKLMNMGNILKRPHQIDTYNCSICVMSTIAHGIFGDPLWRQCDVSMHRIGWFLEVVKHEESHVRASPVSELDRYWPCMVYADTQPT